MDKIILGLIMSFLVGCYEISAVPVISPEIQERQRNLIIQRLDDGCQITEISSTRHTLTMSCPSTPGPLQFWIPDTAMSEVQYRQERVQ